MSINHVLRQVKLTNTLLLLVLCAACTPLPRTTIKTLELRPVNVATGKSGVIGSQGWCLSAGNPPPSAFSAGPGQALVGFDNFFQPGSGPFPCDDIRAQIFRGGVLFDVSQFDVIANATLTFTTDASTSRTGGGAAVAQSPAMSHATTLGIATQAFTSHMLFNADAQLPAGPVTQMNVTSQVHEWITNSRPNFGFVIAGPTDAVDHNNPPKNNNALVSLYSTFRLRIAYNPVQNPRAPQ